MGHRDLHAVHFKEIERKRLGVCVNARKLEAHKCDGKCFSRIAASCIVGSNQSKGSKDVWDGFLNSICDTSMVSCGC